MKAIVHYFTGTGNTAHAALLMSEELKRLDMDVTIQCIDRSTKIQPLEFDYHVFMFPVYALTIPYTMQLYMKKLSAGNGTKAAVVVNYGMLSTKGGLHTGYESQSSIQAARILKRRGYDVFMIDKVGYPENLTVIANAPSKDDCKAIFEAGDLKIKEMAKRIARQERYIKNYGILDLIFGWLFGILFTYFGRWQFGKFYIVDGNCNSCRICERICPANTIHIQGKRPVWGYKCDACLRCYNLCPSKSIQISLPRLLIFIALTIGLIPFITANYSISRDFVSGQLFGNDDLSNYLSGISAVMLCIISYFVLFTSIFYVLEKVIFMLEQIPFIRRVFEKTYTSNIQRYIAPEFEPLKNSFYSKVSQENVTEANQAPCKKM